MGFWRISSDSYNKRFYKAACNATARTVNSEAMYKDVDLIIKRS